jgi:hypothetical protein
MLLSCLQNAEQNRNIENSKTSFENVAKIRYFGTKVTNGNLIQEEIKGRLNSVNACCHSVKNT